MIHEGMTRLLVVKHCVTYWSLFGEESDLPAQVVVLQGTYLNPPFLMTLIV